MAASKVARRLLLAFSVCVALGFITGFLWLHFVADFLVDSEAPQKSDLILVVGGDWTGQRILKAAELAQQGYAPRVWVSGPMELYGVNEAMLAINFAVEHGYPRSLFEPKVMQANSTREEAAAFKREFEKQHARRILLVTSNFHSGRAGRLYRRTLGSQYELFVVTSPYFGFHPDSWWKSREDQKTVFYEWSKTIADLFGI